MATAPDNLFLVTVQEAAREAERLVTPLRKEGAAPDHTINPACHGGEYLVALFLYVE
jgi:23S rRNA G2069 N7-methylase RlmK/C1962 C5-methylase RlmI